MKRIAEEHNVVWKPSPDNRWLIGAHEGLRHRISLWKQEKAQTTDLLLAAKLDGKIEAFKFLLGEI
jgi:hypothetical protein